MSLSLYLAKHFRKSPDRRKHVSSLGANIASFGVMLGLCVMLVSVAIVMGFKKEIRGKVIGFGANIHVVNADMTQNPSLLPLVIDSVFISKIKNTQGVTHVQKVSQKNGIIKTDNDFSGVTFKGVGNDYDTSFLSSAIVKGTIPHYNNNEKGFPLDIIISNTLSQKLNLEVGDKVYSYFFDNDLKMRRFTVSGIYETHLSQFDNAIVFANINTINQLNGWKQGDCSVVEISVKDFDDTEEIADKIALNKPVKADKNGCFVAVYSVGELFSSIFDWLSLLDLNIWIILVLMACVCCFTTTSGLLIQILDKTSIIGLLKALGAGNRLLKQTFGWFGVYVVGRGILFGNVLGLSLCYIQYNFHIIGLNATNYYVDYVPIAIDGVVIMSLNIATAILCFFMLGLPTLIVSRISPTKALRFD